MRAGPTLHWMRRLYTDRSRGHFGGLRDVVGLCFSIRVSIRGEEDAASVAWGAATSAVAAIVALSTARDRGGQAMHTHQG